MCDILPGDEEILDVPTGLLKRKTGFSIDYGGSVIKLVYATDHGDTVRLHFTTYPADRFVEAFTAFAANMKDLQPGQKVFTCGLGCHEHSDYIQDLLKCQMVNVMETDCFVDAFQFLTRNFPFTDVVHPQSDSVLQYAHGMADSWANAQLSFATTFKDACRGKIWGSAKKLIAMKQAAESSGDPGQSSSTDDSGRMETVQYPSILMICGSAGSPLMVYEDGGYDCGDVCSTSGKTLLALGSLLTGAKTFEELVSLAEKGSLDNVDITGRILKKESADVYASLSSEMTAFGFGQAVGKDIKDFRREDLALGVISLVLRSLVESVHAWSLVTKIKQVFFCGGIHASSTLVREMMGKYFEYRSEMNLLGEETDHYFLKHGTHLGALGGLLKTLNADSS